MGKKAKKPAGFGKFSKLLKRVVAVPKDKVDARIAEKHAATKAQREAKSTSRPQQK